MTKLRRMMLELFVLALLVGSSAISLGQLNARASEAPCEGLACTEQQDCGSKCFCNRPSGFCYLDSLETE
jgi:hypothetical protein